MVTRKSYSGISSKASSPSGSAQTVCPVPCGHWHSPKTANSWRQQRGPLGGTHVVELLNAQTGQSMATFQESLNEVLTLAFSADGKFLAAGGDGGAVHVWSMEDKKEATTLKQHDNWVSQVSFSPDGKLLASACADKNVRLWEVGTWKLVFKIPQSEAVHGVAFSPDSNTLVMAVGDSSNRSVRVRKREIDPSKKDKAPQAAVEGNPFPKQTRMIETGAGLPLEIVWNPQGKRVYVACSDKTVRVVEPEPGRIAASLAGHSDWVYCVAVNADGTRFASGSADGTIKLWNGTDNSLLATFVQLAPRTDQWLVFTARGYCNASAANAVQWQSTDPNKPAEKLAGEYNNPEQVKAALVVKKDAPPPNKKP